MVETEFRIPAEVETLRRHPGFSECEKNISTGPRHIEEMI